jgi:hypothetical protein
LQTIVSPDEAIDEDITTPPETEKIDEVKDNTSSKIDEGMMYEPVFKD